MNREMKSGGVVVSGFRNNELFDASSPHNLDDCLLQWRLLRDCFYENGVVLSTADLCDESRLDFLIHVDVRAVNNVGPPCFLVVYETPLTWPKNANLYLYASYRHIFTWDDDVAESSGGTVLRYPQYEVSYFPFRPRTSQGKLAYLIALEASPRRRLLCVTRIGECF